MTILFSFSDKETNDKMNSLLSKGFQYNFDRDIFYNKGTSTVTSLEYVQDNPIDEVLTDNPPNKPRFFFNEEPPIENKTKIAKELNFPHLHNL